ncbi:MAG: hypothetical protein GY929_12655 [Actinomycetia bacterium]|nr:hypothetical protein [Actinomycetes bacterium]
MSPDDVLDADPTWRDADGRFPCPRCGAPTEAELYGPCPACVVQLRATQGSTARDIEVADYEPKMNVTPNAVALKDD